MELEQECCCQLGSCPCDKPRALPAALGQAGIPSLPLPRVRKGTLLPSNPTLCAALGLYKLPPLHAINSSSPGTTSLPQQSCRGVSVGSAPSCCFRNRKTLDVFPLFGAIPAPCSPRCFCCARHCGSPGLECFSGFPSHQTPQISIWEWSLSVQFIPHICLLTHA